MKTSSLILLILLSLQTWAGPQETGLMPELKLEANNEEANQKKATQSEVLIAKSEAKAIAALNAVLKKKKGSRTEPDLWYRLAELYMRRAKSGRFFDMTRSDESSPARFAPPEVRDESAVANLKQAISIYNKIERDFPKFREMDSVLFNNAFANQQTNQRKNAEILYSRLTEKHPRSMLIPDAYLALGEMAYDDGKFALALNHFQQVERFPASRVYSYALYKQAWSHYNMRQTQNGIDKLIQVVKFFSPGKERPKVSHNLRAESLRDLALFFGESHTAEQAYQFFADICTKDELGEAMINLGRLYESHSRQKEMNVFLADFVQRNPNSSVRIKAEILLIKGNETLKNRPKVIEHMKAAAELCLPHSQWRADHASIAEQECDYDLGKENLEIAKKWWDLWLKNKDNKEMAGLTEQAFRIHLNREDPLKPDAKSHYAYAELLYQQGKFREASGQYEIAANQSKDTQIAHDSAYSAIVSLEKASAQSEKSDDSTRLVQLSQAYLTKYPKDPQASQVRFKLGFIAYEEKNYEQAEKWLKPLAQNKSEDNSLRLRSQDLILDMLNAKQDLNGIRDFAKSIMNESDAPERKQNLRKIMQEADYNSIQKDIAKADDNGKSQQAKKLLAFYKENKGSSPLAKESLWQALGIAFSTGKSMEGAELAVEFARTYPEDTRTTDALKDAAKHAHEQGFLLKSAAVFELLAPRLKGAEQEKIYEAISEIYVLEGRKADAREFLSKRLATADKSEQGRLYSRLMASYKGEENSAEYQKLEAKILQLNIEPSATEIQLKRLQEIFDKKKYTEAFNKAKNIVGSDGPRELRAKARLIQAKVLEIELLETRTKTTVDRLSLVLSIKTDKLDKAQTAYQTSQKMTDDPNVHLEALEGLARCYRNYVETVGSPILKTDLKEDEKKALQAELDKLVAPIKEKQLEIEKSLIALAKKEKAAGSHETDFASLPAHETVKPQIPEVSFDRIGFYLPRVTQVEGLFVERSPASVKVACATDEKSMAGGLNDLISVANACVSQKKYTSIEKVAARLAEMEPKSGLAPYYLSVAAAGLGQKEKAAYLVDLAMKKNDSKTMFWYQKSITLGLLGDRAGANQWMIKTFDERLDAWETRMVHGVVAFSQGDCFSVTDDFKALSSESLQRHQLIPALTECMAQKGEIDPALAMLEKTLTTQKSADLAIHLGHLAEVYKSDTKMAASAYQRAKSWATNTDQIEWLTRKLNWLNNPNSVSDSHSLHVGSKVASKDGLGGGQ